MAKAILTNWTVTANQELVDIVEGRISTLTPTATSYVYSLEYTSNEPIGMEHFPNEVSVEGKSCPTLKLKFID